MEKSAVDRLKLSWVVQCGRRGGDGAPSAQILKEGTRKVSKASTVKGLFQQIVPKQVKQEYVLDEVVAIPRRFLELSEPLELLVEDMEEDFDYFSALDIAVMKFLMKPAPPKVTRICLSRSSSSTSSPCGSDSNNTNTFYGFPYNKCPDII